MKIDFAVVCDYAVIDQHGKLSVMGIFQHIWVAKFPTVHPRLHFVMRLRGTRTEIGMHRVNIFLKDEEQHEIIRGDGTVNFSEPPAGVLEIEAGAVLVFDVPFTQPGRYTFEITIDDEVHSTVPMTVSLGPNAQGPDGPKPT